MNVQYGEDRPRDEPVPGRLLSLDANAGFHRQIAPSIRPKSLLESLLAVPLQEGGVRPIECSLRKKRTTVLVDERPDAIGIIDLSRHQDLQVIRQA